MPATASRSLRMDPTTTPLRSNPVFGYVRKSKEESDKQVMSLERQREEVAKFVASRGWGVVDRWFEETQSGKDFDRPAYKRLLAACEANTQRHGSTGRVVCLDYDRFARSVDARLKTNPLEYQRQVIRLYDAGWELDYALTPKSGNMMQDSLTSAMKSLMAGEYIEKLSMTSRSGKRKAGINGNWNGGPPPFPAARYDARTGRRLERGERASNGQSVLGPGDPDQIQHWIDGAHALLAGSSLEAVAQMFDARGVQNYYGGSWRHAHIRKIFTNPALIGRVEYCFTRDDGTEEVFSGDARWTPIVPVDLFHSVRHHLVSPDTHRARPNREYILELECYQCGAQYVAATVRRGGLRRYYTHPVPNSKMNFEQAKRTAKAGCKHWYVPAQSIEDRVRDVIVAQRGTKSFYDLFVSLMAEQGDLQTKAEMLESQAEARVKSLERRRANVLSQLELADSAEVRGALLTRITELTAQVGEAQLEWKMSRDRRNTAMSGQEEVLRLVEEAQHIRETWDQPGDAGLAARRSILATWVDKILIEVVPHEGRERGLERRLHIWLQTSPQPLVCSLPMEGHSSSELLRSMGSPIVVILAA